MSFYPSSALSRVVFDLLFYPVDLLDTVGMSWPTVLLEDASGPELGDIRLPLLSFPGMAMVYLLPGLILFFVYLRLRKKAGAAK